MKALVKKAEPGLWLEDVPTPPVGINDVLSRALAIAAFRRRFRLVTSGLIHRLAELH